jgi:hypothetical protein
MQIGYGPALQRPASRLQLMWVTPDVCWLLAGNLGCWQINVGSRPRILSVNLDRKLRCLQAEAAMFAGRYSYPLTAQGKRSFKREFLQQLRKVHVLYPQARFEVTGDCLILLPGKSHIPAARPSA